MIQPITCVDPVSDFAVGLVAFGDGVGDLPAAGGVEGELVHSWILASGWGVPLRGWGRWAALEDVPVLAILEERGGKG